MEEIVIRQYQKADRDFVRKIAYNTAFMGDPADIFFEGKEILADFLTQYFTDYEPESCFVAQTHGRVIGYLIGAKNTSRLMRIFQVKILSRLLIQAVIKGALLKKKNIMFIFHYLMSFLCQEFKMPDFAKSYPATLHINLEENWRNLKIGSRLITTYLDYLAKAQIRGVYLATLSDRASEFFRKRGFNLLYRGSRSYFRYILHKDVPIYIYGKELL